MTRTAQGNNFQRTIITRNYYGLIGMIADLVCMIVNHVLRDRLSIHCLSCVLCSGLWVSRRLLQGSCAVFDSQTEYQFNAGTELTGVAVGLPPRSERHEGSIPCIRSNLWCSGRAANARACKVRIIHRGFESHLHLQIRYVLKSG